MKNVSKCLKPSAIGVYKYINVEGRYVWYGICKKSLKDFYM